MSAPKILISAGEASSDMYAARLATALRKRTGAARLHHADGQPRRPQRRHQAAFVTPG